MCIVSPSCKLLLPASLLGLTLVASRLTCLHHSSMRLEHYEPPAIRFMRYNWHNLTKATVQ